ncbi:hypothetical protein ABZ793_06125 [Micromonospora sp. NPDC047465]|uniref:hypothetical protein n=1 Tax=Micromonospora sp. NPDC047465 TaxID=3154813 RepID=UPI0033D2535E
MSDGQITLACTNPSCKSTNVAFVREHIEPLQRAWGGQVLRRQQTVEYECNDCGEDCTFSRVI